MKELYQPNKKTSQSVHEQQLYNLEEKLEEKSPSKQRIYYFWSLEIK